MSYRVADFMIGIKNAAMARRREVTLPYSLLHEAIGALLVREGFLTAFRQDVHEGRKMLVGTIAYQQRKPVLTDVEVISKPSLRFYTKAKEIGQLYKKGARTLIFSTSMGVMTEREVRKKGVGGELLFAIW